MVCQQTFKSSTIIATGTKVTAEDGQSDNQRQLKTTGSPVLAQDFGVWELSVGKESLRKENKLL